MPVHREAASLVELGMRRASKDLEEACRRLQSISLESSGQNVLEYAKCVLRPYYVNSLPGTIRSRIIDKTSRRLYGRGNDGLGLFSGPSPLYLLTILLGPDINRLRINLCCYYGCSHQADILKLLATEGTGLESLELARSALLRLDCKLLGMALVKMSNLRSLTMRNIASDSILEVVGRSCPRLVVLDVACSKQVTDVGFQQLLVQLRVRVQTDPTMKRANREKQLEESSTDTVVKICDRRIGTTWSKIKTLLPKLKSKAEKNDNKDGFLLEFSETQNDICDSLKIINCTKTSVTSAGVLFVLRHATNLESLADYSSIGRVIEINNRGAVSNLKKGFKLTQARDSGTTIKRLENLADSCSRLEKLWIVEPRHPAEALRVFSSLKSLTLDVVPADKGWIQGLYGYLRTNGSTLGEFNIRILQNNEELEFDLREVFLNCPNLVSFTKQGSRVGWLDGEEPSSPHKQLRRIQIGENVSPKTVIKILTLAPKINFLHIHSSDELTDQHLEILPDCPIVENLKCFYIHQAKKLTANSTVSILMDCKNLRHIGNLMSWGLECDDIEMLWAMLKMRNIDIEICPVSHWLWNTCYAY